MLCLIHLFQIAIALHKLNILTIPTNSESLLFPFLLAFALIAFILSKLIKETDLKQLKEQYDYNWDKVYNGNVWLIGYIILSFALLIVLAII